VNDDARRRWPGGEVALGGLPVLLLLVQDATDRFDTWAYAWTLVFLVGPGIGRWLLGMVRGRRELAASGGGLIAVGLVGFLGFAVFFELVVGFGGHRSGAASGYVLAAVLILAGLGPGGPSVAGGQAAPEVRPAPAMPWWDP
jgi:hypothetical protein